MTTWKQKLAQRLDALQASSQWRKLRASDCISPGKISIAGQKLLDFCSNDYLSLRHHPKLIQRACEYSQKWGTGSGASRLLAGNLVAMEAVEAKLALGKETEAALIFNSGFQANATILPCLIDLLGRNTLVFADKLNHASLHHGCQAARIRQIRFRHQDLHHLETLLRSHHHPGHSRIIISETVFSMDGDQADIPKLVHLAEKYDALLYLDEAHATGVFGPRGFGLTVGHKVDIVMGTFGKALGSFGAYVACSQKMRHFLINRCAGFIYSTALPPSAWGAVDAALDLLPYLDSERLTLMNHSQRIRKILSNAGLDIGASSTQIIPVILGDEPRTLDVAKKLEGCGIYTAAVRYPTVPIGQSRIRISLQSGHTEQDINRLVDTLLGATL